MGIKGLLKELKDNGFSYKDVDKIFEQKVIQPAEVDIILKWIPALYKEHVGTADIAVRSLMAARTPFDPSLLIDLFDNSDLNSALKVGIGFTLACAKTTDISKWMRRQLLDKEHRDERYTLLEGLFDKGKFATVDEFMDFLRKIFDNYPNDKMLKLFKKYGDKKDMQFLAEKAKTAEPKLAREINKVIEKKKV